MSELLRVTRLENGVRVVTETVRDVPSLALGVWVDTGSRYEEERTIGIAHFAEHLLFKGTPSRSAREIAESIERRGGSIDAFTDKEYTCYHARVLHEHGDVALEVLSDLVLHAEPRAQDVELEREVIIQEILDVEDDPEEYCHDHFLSCYWPGHPLGWPVAGTLASVERITREDVVGFLREFRRPDRLVISAAGRLDHDDLVARCRAIFGSLEPQNGAERRIDRPDFRPGLYVVKREIEQAHVLIGMPGLSVIDPRREAAEVLIAALGGGMSSRLFQRIREERGKAYSIYAFQDPFHDIGYTGVYAACARESVAEVSDIIFEELRSVCRDGLGAGELDRVKNQLVGSIPLSLETTDSRMSRIGRNMLYFDRPLAIEEITRAIEAVTNDDIVALARELFSFDRAAAVLLGDVEGDLMALPAT
ncbi:MAG TPA: pitrilysin family protein [Candidatus Limnocylindrales bacterium]|nr:pitrilysin family protein [Candidatus Limnocylindrales bacterium]